MNNVRVVVILFAPLLAGLVVHGLCRRFGWLRSFGGPIDRGRTLRGRPLFGASKTWRGVWSVALGTGAAYAILAVIGVLPGGAAPSFGTGQFAFIGAAMGAAAMLGELPIAFLTRQLGIAPWATARGIATPVFWLLDHVSVLPGAWLVLGPIVGVSWPRVAWSVAFVAITHALVSMAAARANRVAPVDRLP